jgi:hypothetical protein
MTQAGFFSKASKAARRVRDCQNPKCAAYILTIAEFMLLRGEDWTQGFKVKLGRRAGELFEQLYGKKWSQKVRTHLLRASTSRNMVRTYPCGILEQGYRALVSEGHVATRKGVAPYVSPTLISRPVAIEPSTAPTTMKVEPSPQNAT